MSAEVKSFQPMFTHRVSRVPFRVRPPKPKAVLLVVGTCWALFIRALKRRCGLKWAAEAVRALRPKAIDVMPV